jgi:hypothetical protein
MVIILSKTNGGKNANTFSCPIIGAKNSFTETTFTNEPIACVILMRLPVPAIL